MLDFNQTNVPYFLCKIILSRNKRLNNRDTFRLFIPTIALISTLLPRATGNELGWARGYRHSRYVCIIVISINDDIIKNSLTGRVFVFVLTRDLSWELCQDVLQLCQLSQKYLDLISQIHETRMVS